MSLPDFLVQDVDGYIHVTGHRVGLQDLVHYYNEGHSAEALCDVFPTLPLALVHKVIGYYLEHRADMDARLAADEAETERQRATAPHGPGVVELRRRLAARQATRA